MAILAIDDLGWTREYAAAVRLMFGAIADDWDDPEMDVYDHLPADDEPMAAETKTE